MAGRLKLSPGKLQLLHQPSLFQARSPLDPLFCFSGMYNSFGQGSSGLSSSDSSNGSSGHSPSRAASPYTPAAPRPADSSNFYSHPARTSLLSADGQLLVDTVPGLAGIPRGDSIVMDTSANDDMRHVWSASGSLPSFSRAFDRFTQPPEADGSSSRGEGQFFVPSYLRGSTYMHALEEAHKAKVQAQKETKRSTGNGVTNSANAFTQASLPPGAHRGLAHNVIERQPAPAADNDAALAPLPTRWNKDDAWTGIDLQPDDLSVRYTGPKTHHERDHEASAARADHYVSPQCGLYYFEVQILHGKRDECVSPCTVPASGASDYPAERLG